MTAPPQREPSPQDLSTTPTSVEEIGLALKEARLQAGLSPEDAAARSGITPADLDALESGAVGRLRDRVETLRALRGHADTLGLPGTEFMLALVEHWPDADPGLSRVADSGQVPSVSVTAAPAGVHSPAGDESTQATAFSISGVVSPLVSAPTHDTGPVPIVDTGEIPAVRTGEPRWLKVLVVTAALLVVFGLFSLTEHAHFRSWGHSLHADSDRWVHDAKVAMGLSPKTQPHTTAPGGLPKVVITQNAAAHSATINVSAPTFNVKMVAYKAPSWMQITSSEQATPVYEQVMSAGDNRVFAVQHSLTVETGNTSARAYIYDGYQFIGFYFPDKAPFTLTFNATG
jgi:hypothetical protein